jgi:hypothetical protein
MSVSNIPGNDNVGRRERATEAFKTSRNEQWSRRENRRFDKPSVAGLATGAIARMSREELIRVIDGSALPLIDGRNRQRLNYLDRASLERLAQLGRRCCRNQGY